MLRLLGECRDACLASLQEAAGHLTDKLQAEKLSPHLVMTSLKDCTDVSSTSGPPGPSSIVQSALLSEATLRHFRQVTASAKKQQSPVFCYTRSDNMAAVVDNLRHFMGTVAPSGGGTVSHSRPAGNGQESSNEGPNGQHVQLLTNAGDTELARLRHELSTLQTQTGQLLQDNQQLRADLRTWKQCVAADVGGLKKDVRRLQGDTLKAAGSPQNVAEPTVTPDTGNLQRDLGTVSPGGANLQRDPGTVSLGDGNLRRDLGTVLMGGGNLQTDLGTVSPGGGSLQRDLGTVSPGGGSLQRDLGTVSPGGGSFQRDLGTVSPGGGDLQRDEVTVTRPEAPSPQQCNTCSLHNALTSVQADTSRSQQYQKQTEALVRELKAQMGEL